jgi:uncharacterized protein YndB with AHSA1/START domain
MLLNKESIFKKDLENKKMYITREFDAPVEKVWRCWTEPELLDQWWAPEPYKTVTVNMDFQNGGRWLYYMISPEGNKHYGRADYRQITPIKTYSAIDTFCDEHGNADEQFPGMDWKVEFVSLGNISRVDIVISFTSIEVMEKIIEMGFQEGFTMAHGNLDKLLAK